MECVEEHLLEVVLLGEYSILSVLAIDLDPMLIAVRVLFLERVQIALKLLLRGELIDVTHTLDIL